MPGKNRTIASKIPPRFAKKQGSMGIEQPEEGLSSNNLGTEIWETNSSGSYQITFNVYDGGEQWLILLPHGKKVASTNPGRLEQPTPVFL